MKKILFAILIVAILGFAVFETSEDVKPAAVPEEPVLTEEEKAEIRRTEELLPILDEAKKLAQGYFYEEALEVLSTVPDEFSEDQDVVAARTEYEEQQN